MTNSTRASLAAIGRQLYDHSSTLAKPLPSELKDLVAQLVVLETVTQSAIAQPGAQS